MAYSDYGGYAYRNGEHVPDRSDAVLSPDGIKSTPGQWPGWTIPEGRSGNSYHTVLGDGPILVGLYKQSSLIISRLGESLDILPLSTNVPATRVSEYNGQRYLDAPRQFIADVAPSMFEVDDHRIEVFWRYYDNFYLFVRLTQPDGTVWTGFSGYGVGAGLEDADYGFSTDDRVADLQRLFPAGQPGRD